VKNGTGGNDCRLLDPASQDIPLTSPADYRIPENTGRMRHRFCNRFLCKISNLARLAVVGAVASTLRIRIF
jgi:hypothetical protein